jgi:hypothetical protein
VDATTATFLEYEAQALLARLARIKSFALHEATVPAAGLDSRATAAIERHLSARRREAREQAHRFLAWLQTAEGRNASAEDAQRRFTLLRLRFGHVLTHHDLFLDVLTQRSENETGVWLAGLDALATDALDLPGRYEHPPVICYLDRGVGAAIRRARTRLPGGSENPVAVIRIPRERMIGTSIASSLVHEVGHQAAALLDLVKTLRDALQRRAARERASINPWRYWERWISEIVADFWSVARVGICSSLGLIGVVSLPRPFVFRIRLDDPHPFPWIRVHASCAIGDRLFPHPQWERVRTMWSQFYPPAELPAEQSAIVTALLDSLAELAHLLATHRSTALQGESLVEALQPSAVEPEQLQRRFARWQRSPAEMYASRPTQVFATIGQARFDGRIAARDESQLIAKLLTHWALSKSIDAAERCSQVSGIALAVPAI